MITFQDTYDSRKNEIENFLELMKFLEQKENEREDGKSKFSEFFYPENGGIHLTYQALINILKSNVSLMIYNIIEYTVTNLIDSIYDEIRINHLSYIDVNDSIRSLWRKTILKSVNDPNANFSTFLKKNEEIISAILSNNELNMYAKNTLPGGNLDGNSIKETFESHGIQVRTNSRNLAHGSVSFVEAMREDSIDDIKTSETLVVGFLEELIETVSTYIEEQKYKTS